ncbi:hypothetical protein AB0365_02795 [Brevibacterium casei]|uniref:hypothetical protein n=1 Tax=Brevibacterium casei TaxID=33889 RepID=UPI00344FD079
MSSTMRLITDPAAWIERAFADPVEDVILASPRFVHAFSQRIAEAAAGSARTWAVVTTIDPVAVVRGSLSIDGLQLLLDADVQVQHVDRLRTHCLFVGRRALLGSANLGRADERAVYLDGEEAAAENLASPMELAVELTEDHLAEAWAQISRRRSVVVDAQDLDWLRAQVREA